MHKLPAKIKAAENAAIPRFRLLTEDLPATLLDRQARPFVHAFAFKRSDHWFVINEDWWSVLSHAEMSRHYRPSNKESRIAWGKMEKRFAK